MASKSLILNMEYYIGGIYMDNFENNEEKSLMVIEPKFFSERIERKKKFPSKKIIALLMVFTLLLGTGIGYGIGVSFGDLAKGNIVMAAPGETLSADNIVTSGIWPVVGISKKVSPAIVAIKTKTNVRNYFGDVYESGGTGSGIIIDKEGHIVTNNHVIEGAKDIVVLLNDGKEIAATIVGRDAQTDLAVLKVEERNLPYVDFGDSSKLEVGELAVAIGSPMGTEYAGSVTAGIISGLDRKVSVGDKTMSLIQTDAAINPGNSGGALVNSKGQVIGINTLKLIESKVEGMGFAIPINEAKPIIQQLIENKQIVRPQLGITGSTVTADVAKTYNVPTGVAIVEVSPYSGADRAGLKRGDIITEIDGKKVSTIEEVIAIVKTHKVNDVLKVKIFNSAEKYETVDVTLRQINQ